MTEKKYPYNHQGFTLIEIMIVVALIGILSAVAILQFSAYRTRGYNSASLSDTRLLSTNETAFYSSWQIYGASFTGAALPGPGGTGAVVPGAVVNGPSSPTSGISGTDTNGILCGINIPLSNNVSILARTALNNSTFLAISKHLQGDAFYGIDSESNAIYMNKTAPLGFSVTAVDLPVAAPTNNNDIAGVVNWHTL